MELFRVAEFLPIKWVSEHIMVNMIGKKVISLKYSGSSKAIMYTNKSVPIFESYLLLCCI